MLLKQKQRMLERGDRKQLVLIKFVSVILGPYAVWKIKSRLFGQEKKQLPSEVKLASGDLPYFGHYFELFLESIGFIKRCKAENVPAFILQINGKRFTF